MNKYFAQKIYLSYVCITNCSEGLTGPSRSQRFDLNLEDAPEWVVHVIMARATSQVHYSSHCMLIYLIYNLIDGHDY